MSGKGQNNQRGATMRCDPENVPQVTHAGGVKSNNREQHLGRSFPQQNGTLKMKISDGGLRPVPSMPVTPKQAYSQSHVTKGQKMPDGNR